VVNTKSDLEIWIPRRLLGDVSSVEDPVMIVGLATELEYKAGRVWPHERRVLERPAAPRPATPAAPAASSISKVQAAGIRTAESAEARVGRFIAAVLLAVVLACGAIFALAQLTRLRGVKFATVDQDVLSLTHRDDYYSVVRKLGPPASDRWRSGGGELKYRALWYPDRSCYVILVGMEENDVRYIGSLDRDWRVLHSVEIGQGGNTASMLRTVPRF
jgi:hypothetical protein